MAVYKTWEEIRSIPLDTPIWACAYAFDNNKETMGLKQEPIQGAIHQARQMYFFPFRKGSTTEFITSKKVHYLARVYADTQEECLALYNQLIQDKISYFLKRIKEVQKDLRLTCDDCLCKTCEDNSVYIKDGKCAGCSGCHKIHTDSKPVLCRHTGDYV